MENLKHLFSLSLLSALLFSLQTAHAQSMADVWLSQPSYLVPYVDAGQRAKMISNYGKLDADTVKNQFGEAVYVDTLTADYISVRWNEALQMELKKLPAGPSDTLLCVVRTYYGPSAESSVAYYDLAWRPVQVAGYLSDFSADRLFCLPDGMTEAEFLRLKALYDPLLIACHLSADDQRMAVSVSEPPLPLEDAEAARTILAPVYIEWGSSQQSLLSPSDKQTGASTNLDNH